MVQTPARKVIHIDGSFGEGGGQILRTSMALSCVLGKPVEIVNIRRDRMKPGLQPQHLTAVIAAAAISRADVQGAELSSTAIKFLPGPISGGDYVFDVSQKKGSAGSTSLVLQTIILPLCFAERPSSITVLGGTHVPWSPTFHYLKYIFLPILSRINSPIDLNIKKWGWYPAGGGAVTARINPPAEFRPLRITNRGALLRVTGLSATANLPQDIALRQRDRALHALRHKGIEADIEIIEASSPGKGTLVFLQAEFENITAGFDALGAIGKRAEEVAEEACHKLFRHLDASGAVDPHLADQLIPYLALARGDSEFTTSRVTQHLLTNIWAVQQFLDVGIHLEGKEGEGGHITIRTLSALN
jgi:RNA 3'-terminal phosphate cyclase (ATP)